MTGEGWTIAGVLGVVLAALGIVVMVGLFVLVAALRGIEGHEREMRRSRAGSRRRVVGRTRR